MAIEQSIVAEACSWYFSVVIVPAADVAETRNVQEARTSDMFGLRLV